jgi:glycosyltransferase involved in cell wall biosynthesis
VANHLSIQWAAECVAVIPCFNESLAIGRLVQRVRQHLAEVIVVDDGSTDQTGKVAKEAGALVFRHAKRRGKGAALETAWSHAHQSGFSWALSLDGDGQHDSSEIPFFLRKAESTGAHLVIGNRMERPDQMPILRRLVNRWMSRRLSQISGRFLPDSQCGFRLMNLRAWSGLSISSQHFEIESEVLLAFTLASYRVEFVPVSTIYRRERSKINPLQDTLRWLRW